jgi:hypothetical protein
VPPEFGHEAAGHKHGVSPNPAALPDLTTRIGLIEHRIESIRLALAAADVPDNVRAVLGEHLSVAESALDLARRAA